MESKISYAWPYRKAILFAVLATVTLFIAAFSKGVFMKTANVQPPVPAVHIKPLKDFPMYISAAKLSRTDSLSLEAELSLANIGSKPIRAYTIRYDVETVGKKALSSGAQLVNSSSLKSVLQPHSSHKEVMDCGSYSIPLENIIFSIDFAEFTDGTNLGPDVYKSAERLSGKRSGGRAASDYLLSKYRENGLQAVISALDKSLTDIIPATGLISPEWLDGFQSGKSAVFERIRHTYNKHGLASVLDEIGKPYDASEGRL